MPFLSSLSPQQKRMLFLGGPVFLGAIAVGSTFIQRGLYRPLFTHLSPQDAAAVVSELEAQKIPYGLRKQGSVIEVPSKVLYRTRLDMASKGLPVGGGVGFEIFERASFGVSEFTQRVNYLRALQGELSRTLNAMNVVRSSRVHLVLPARSAFFGPTEKPSASVVMDLKAGSRLTAKQTSGIVKLVAASVPGLTPDKVTVVDTVRGLLTLLDGEDGGTEPELLHRLKVRKERELERRIQNMLALVLGPDRSVTRVNVELNFKESEQTRQEFDPSNRIIRSQQRITEGSSVPAGGLAGVQSNIPGGDSGKQGGKQGEEQGEKQEKTPLVRSSESVSYEVGRITSRIVEPRGQISRLSVVVMVDGNYEGEVYSPRPEEEMEALKVAVMKTVGFDAERGDEVELINMPIKGKPPSEEVVVLVPEAPEWFLSPVVIGVGVGTLLVLVFFGLLLGWRRGRQIPSKVEKVETGAKPAIEESRREVKEDVSGAVQKIVVAQDPRREQITLMAQEHRDAIINVLRSWLQEEMRKRRSEENVVIEVGGGGGGG